VPLLDEHTYEVLQQFAAWYADFISKNLAMSLVNTRWPSNVPRATMNGLPTFATRMWQRTDVREANRARAPDSPSPGGEVLWSAQAASADVSPGVSRLSARRTYRSCVGKGRTARLDEEQ
jgi:hypothetical protein